ncbi:hypothetical protein PtA15_18A295 [Puccinia triticina]|nr:uncharacterized protein PtA15_18A295 [Puccinia triticina]WAQ93237.1 hypothetical protein PtA15_18A295 [Puccinia triticina]WAR63218.1 hypothetical protein PtB15_18B300 [Puccinia triticina]
MASTGTRWPAIELPAAGTNALATSAFATYVLSLVGYAVYLLHALLPAASLHSYFPSQAWPVLLPAWTTVAVWFLFLSYFATNLAYSPPTDGPHALAALTDRHALIIPHPSHPPPASEHDLPVPVLRDLPCQLVNQFYFN